MQDHGDFPPIFRTDTQRKLLIELLFDQGERPRTLSDLARAIGVEQTTVMREVNRLLESGLLREMRIGRSRTVEINDRSPFAAPLRQLLRAGRPSSEERRPQRRRNLAHEERKRHERRPLPSSQSLP